MYYAPFEECAMAGNAAIIRGIYDAFARGDVAAVLGALDDRVEWNEAEHIAYWPGGAHVGPQAVVAGVFGPLMQDFDNFRIDVRRVVAAGDTVLVEARYRATAKATGKALDAQVAHVWDLRDGKVVRFQQYTDTLQFAQVGGVAPHEKTLA
jgi:ketosteroid isomerase-like protein